MASFLFTLAKLAWLRRRCLSWAAVVGVLSSAIVGVSLPERFESTTRLMPTAYQINSLSFSENLGGATEGELAEKLLSKNSQALNIGLLRSRTVEDRLIERFDLKKAYGIQEADKARSRLSENTVISQDLKSGITTITFTDKNSQRASAVCAGYVLELNRLIIELDTALARQKRLFIERRLEIVKLAFDSSTEALAAFAAEKVVIDAPLQAESMVKSEVRLRSELMAAKSELRATSETYSDSNVRAREAVARVNGLQNSLDRMAAKPRTDFLNPTSPNGSVYPSIRELPLLLVPYSELRRRAALLGDLYETLDELLRVAKFEESRQIPFIQILDPADVPENTSGPPQLEIILFGTLLVEGLELGYLLSESHWQNVLTRLKKNVPKKNLKLDTSAIQ